MSTTRPMEPELPGGDDGIPAADAGAGAPPPADGFGRAGEEPDVLEEPADRTDAEMPAATPFRTPDPTEIGPDVGQPRAVPGGPPAGRGAGMSTTQPGHDPSTEPTSDDAATQGTEPTGNPVDPAMASSSPDPGQTERDLRHEGD